MNMLEARIERANGGLAAVLGETRLALDDETLSGRPALHAYEGREVVLGIRPEDLEDAALANGDPRPRLRGRVACARRSGRRCSCTSRSPRPRRSPRTFASSRRMSATTGPWNSSSPVRIRFGDTRRVFQPAHTHRRGG